MIKKLAKSIREYKKPAILTSISVMLEVIMEVLIPYVMASLIDEGVSCGDISATLKYGLILTIMAIMSLLFGFLSGSFCATASSGFSKNLRKDMFEKIQTFSFSNIDKYSSAGLVTRLTTDISYVQNAFQMLIRLAIRAPLMLIFTIIMTISINAQLSLVFAVAGPILCLLIFLVLRKVHPSFKKVIQEYEDLNRVVEENVRGARVVKSYVREDYEIEKFDITSEQIYKDYSHARKLMSLNSPIMSATAYACLLVISFLGAKIIVNSSGTALECGQLTTMFSYTMQILSSLLMFSYVLMGFTISRPSAERIVEILDEVPSIKNPESPIMKVKNGDIDFENVSFSYKGDISKLCLKDVNLHIKSGETIGILGATGSSKTTLVSLIPRLFDATSGEIFVGGKNVKEYDLAVLRDSVSMVLQKNVLFSGTVKENLLWGNKNASDEEIKQACDIACASEFVEKMPEKYDTHIEQGGSNVSGGQKQRLCIARALLKKPKILILDDSTSAVDTKTDARIKKALRETMPKVTKIVIAQRVSSVQDADRIIILDGGKIVAIGSHKELLKTSDLYNEIYNSQTKKGGK
jgi:ATP-binding cassette, subfamily B, multidrug efflux pump